MTPDPAPRPESKKPRRKWLRRGLAVVGGLLVVLVGLEIVFRCLPVSDALKRQPVDDAHPYLHYEPNREIVYSRNWDFAIRTRKRCNNYGFMSDGDYLAQVGTSEPLMAIIGDSYVEAMHVENHQAIAGLLQNRVDGRGSVYGLGISAAPLSQYLAWAEFSREEFAPHSIVFVVAGNDFDESLLAVKWQEGMHFFEEGEEDLELVRVDSKPYGLLRRTTRKSALMRYLFLTVGLDWRGVARGIVPSEVQEKRSFVGNTDAAASPERLRDSRRAVDAFLGQIPARSGLPPERILLVIDGFFRFADPSESAGPEEIARAQASFFGLMRAYLMEEARHRGHEVVDLDPIFRAHHAIHAEPFSWPFDAHWNARAHRIVADAVAGSAAFGDTFD